MRQPEESVLIADDEPLSRSVCEEVLRPAGFSVALADDGASAIEAVRRHAFKVAVVDLCMPGISGLDAIRQIKSVRPETEIVILTAHPTLESMIGAIDEHVFGYLCKPVDASILARTVRSAAMHHDLSRRNRDLMAQLKHERSSLRKRVLENQAAFERQIAASPALVGNSKAMARVRSQIAVVAPTSMTVMLRGESGTGKDIVAKLIHEISGRDSTGKFVKINCPAIPESLFESELFGHEAGAFTGADHRKPGRFEIAAGGTVFLDEIGEIPLSLQPKLLQVIEHKQFSPLGSTQTKTVDARIVTATNAPIEKMIAENLFRRDLFYRLDEYCIALPPLRERTDDIPLLVEHFLKKHALPHLLQSGLSLSGEAMEALTRHSWPGNVRELEAVVRRFALTGSEDAIMSSLERAMPGPPVRPPDPPAPLAPPSPASAGGMLRDGEKKAILWALDQAGWNRRKAAGILGTSYSTIRRKISLYNIRKP